MMRKKDMYLPIWVLALGILFITGGVICLCRAFSGAPLSWLGVPPCFCLGFAAILCWKNQWVEMISDEEFVYSNMFGRQTAYRVSQIWDIRRGADSMTLILENGKVHIENCAVLSERFLRILHKPVKKDAFFTDEK